MFKEKYVNHIAKPAFLFGRFIVIMSIALVLWFYSIGLISQDPENQFGLLFMLIAIGFIFYGFSIEIGVVYLWGNCCNLLVFLNENILNSKNRKTTKKERKKIEDLSAYIVNLPLASFLIYLCSAFVSNGKVLIPFFLNFSLICFVLLLILPYLFDFINSIKLSLKKRTRRKKR